MNNNDNILGLDLVYPENSDITIDSKIDLLQSALLSGELMEFPLTHKFIKGMYIRELFMPASIFPNKTMIVTGAIHTTEHPYFILKGEVAVFSENEGEKILYAGDSGITYPGTRRVVRIIKDTLWVSCHTTDIQPKDNSKEAIEEAARLVMDSITDSRINPLLEGRFDNNKFIPFTEKERSENNKKLN